MATFVEPQLSLKNAFSLLWPTATGVWRKCSDQVVPPSSLWIIVNELLLFCPSSDPTCLQGDKQKERHQALLALLAIPRCCLLCLVWVGRCLFCCGDGYGSLRRPGVLCVILVVCCDDATCYVGSGGPAANGEVMPWGQSSMHPGIPGSTRSFNHQSLEDCAASLGYLDISQTTRICLRHVFKKMNPKTRALEESKHHQNNNVSAPDITLPLLSPSPHVFLTNSPHPTAPFSISQPKLQHFVAS